MFWWCQDLSLAVVSPQNGGLSQPLWRWSRYEVVLTTADKACRPRRSWPLQGPGGSRLFSCPLSQFIFPGSRFRALCSVLWWCSQSACQVLSPCPVTVAVFHRFSGSEIFLSIWIPKISFQVLSWLSILVYNPDSLNHCYKAILKVSILAFPCPDAFLLIRNSKEGKVQFVFQDCTFWFHFKHHSTLPFLTLCRPWMITVPPLKCFGGDLFPFCRIIAAVYFPVLIISLWVIWGQWAYIWPSDLKWKLIASYHRYYSIKCYFWAICTNTDIFQGACTLQDYLLYISTSPPPCSLFQSHVLNF